MLCLQCGVEWVRIPPEAAFVLWKSDCLGCAVFPRLVCLTLLASLFLPSASLINTYNVYKCTCTVEVKKTFPLSFRFDVLKRRLMIVPFPFWTAALFRFVHYRSNHFA